jgi:hypothetical protein
MDQRVLISNETDFQRWLLLILSRERQRLAAENAARRALQINEFGVIEEKSSPEGVRA